MATNLVELCKEFDIDPMRVMTGDLSVLAEMRTKYEELVGEVRQSVTATETQLTAALVSAKGNEELVKLANTVKSEVWDVIIPAIDDNPEVSILLFELLKEVNSLVKYDRDCFINSAKLTSGAVAKMPTPEKNEKASLLGETIRNLMVQFKSLGATDEQFAKIENFPGKISDKTGKFIPEMSKLRTDTENSSAGRPLTGIRYRFRWNGEELPAKLSLEDVARNYVSDRKAGYYVKSSVIVDMVKAAKLSATKDDYTLTFDTGTLEAWIPKAES